MVWYSCRRTEEKCSALYTQPQSENMAAFLAYASIPAMRGLNAHSWSWISPSFSVHLNFRYPRPQIPVLERIRARFRAIRPPNGSNHEWNRKKRVSRVTKRWYESSLIYSSRNSPLTLHLLRHRGSCCFFSVKIRPQFFFDSQLSCQMTTSTYAEEEPESCSNVSLFCCQGDMNGPRTPCAGSSKVVSEPIISGSMRKTRNIMVSKRTYLVHIPKHERCWATSSLKVDAQSQPSAEALQPHPGSTTVLPPT